MLTTKLGNALANKTILSIVLAALITVGVLAAQVISMSLELEGKSRTIELQGQEIEQHLAAIALQRQEVEAKAAQLEQLNSEIAAKSQEADALGAELAGLQTQAQRLQAEMTLLQSKIKSDEQYVASLLQQLELTQESAKRVKISHYSLAVINSEQGIVFPIEVEIINSGAGAISVDVSNAQYEDAFQGAVRTAAAVASEYTGVPISNKDIIVRIIDDLPDGELATIDGSSAGALIAGMMVAGLTDGQVNDKVLVTGTINPNGTVGKVGSIDEKTEAAMDFGAHILVVPKSQEFDSDRLVVAGALDIDDVMRYLIAPD